MFWPLIIVGFVCFADFVCFRICLYHDMYTTIGSAACPAPRHVAPHPTNPVSQQGRVYQEQTLWTYDVSLILTSSIVDIIDIDIVLCIIDVYQSCMLILLEILTVTRHPIAHHQFDKFDRKAHSWLLSCQGVLCVSGRMKANNFSNETDLVPRLFRSLGLLWLGTSLYSYCIHVNKRKTWVWICTYFQRSWSAK